jgi:hypothetical protein
LNTLLDEFHSCFLRAVVYADGELRIVVAEGFRTAQPEDITIAGHVIKDTYAVDTSDKSRLVEVRFSKPIAWQLVDESFTGWDEYEERDDKSKLQLLGRSKYLDYVRKSHGWFEDIRGPGKHYRVWTENEVMDVVACEPPVVGITAGT